MKVTLKRNQLESIWNMFSTFAKKPLLFDVSLAVARTKQVLRGELDLIEEVSKPPEQYAEFEKERVELLRKHAKRDSAGKPITSKSPQGGDMVDLVNYTLFEEEFSVLRDKYYSAIQEQENLVKQREKSMCESIELEVMGIPKSALKNTSWTGEEMDALLLFILDDENK